MEVWLEHKIKICVRFYEDECGVNINVLAKLLWKFVTTFAQLITKA